MEVLFGPVRRPGSCGKWKSVTGVPSNAFYPSSTTNSGLPGMSEQLGISKGTLWYWLLKYNVSVRRVALGPGESLEIHRES